MKILNYIIIVCVCIVGFSSCETYSDQTTDYTALHPVDGEWTVHLTNMGTGEVIGVRAYTYNTAENSQTAMWLIVGNQPGDSHRSRMLVKGKVAVDVPSKTFSGEDIEDTYNIGTTFSVSDGMVIEQAATTPSGYPADSIHLIVTTSDSTMYDVSGFRRSGWEEDEVY